MIEIMDFTREFRESRFLFVIFVRCYVATSRCPKREERFYEAQLPVVLGSIFVGETPINIALLEKRQL